jgi:hypothetical protein
MQAQTLPAIMWHSHSRLQAVRCIIQRSSHSTQASAKLGNAPLILTTENQVAAKSTLAPAVT